MKTLKSLQIGALLFAFALSSCNESEENGHKESADIDYSAEYAESWANYSRSVALLLKNDASSLCVEWTTNGFAEKFKSGSWSGSYNESVQQILDGCIDIANEVGTAKIGEPYDYWKAGKTTKAVYAVESWYSWHSRDDYSNNIKSIANTLLGVRLGTNENPTASILAKRSENSILAYGLSNEKYAVATQKVWDDVVVAWNSIQAIPQPFRNNIASAETVVAMQACENLTQSLETLKAMVQSSGDEDALKPIVVQFVDEVVVPTYKLLRDRNAALFNAVVTLGEKPSNEAFENACEAWMKAREHWETSEAFLFGPVDEMGLDPNMDSWPLDQDQIVKILKSGDYSKLTWDDNDSNKKIEASQTLRGFHTLEFLLFKEGNPRTIK